MRIVTGLVVVAMFGCGSINGADDVADPNEQLEASVVGAVSPGLAAASLAALDDNQVAIARATVTGDAFCPDCVDLDPAECPAQCQRTHVSLTVLDATSGAAGRELDIQQVFPKSFDHDVDQVEAVALGSDRVGVAWLDCDNARCGGLFAKRSCTARYTVVDVDTGATTPVVTLYENRFGNLQLVRGAGQLLAVTGMSYGTYGTGVRAAVFDETGQLLSPWTAIGGIDALSPSAAATDDGFAIVVDDRRPDDAPPATPCASSCDCSGSIQVDPIAGGVYVYELSSTGALRRDPIAIGLAQDGHLPNGHYHAREVLAVMRRDDDLVVAAGQAIDMEAELFVGRRESWNVHGGFDSPIPLWIGVIGTGDTIGWLGSQPQPGAATVNRIVAGIATSASDSYGPITDPVDSYIFEAAPLATSAGVTSTFLLRGIFDRTETSTSWKQFEIVKVTQRSSH